MPRVILAVLTAVAIIVIPGSLVALSIYAAIRAFVKRKHNT